MTGPQTQIDPPQGAAASSAWSARAAQRLGRLRAVILLSGAVRTTRLTRGIRRSLLNLPIDNERSVMDQWHEHAAALAAAMDRGPMPVRVLVNPTARQPTLPTLNGRVVMQVQADPMEFRGTGGVLRDISIEYDDDDLLLVANGAQVMLEPLAHVAGAMAEKGGDVSIVAHRDGAPSGIMLVRAGTLRAIPANGFHDFKEQSLPAIATRFDVTVTSFDRPTGLPIRTLGDYMTALRWYHRKRSGYEGGDPFGEDWRSAFTVVERGAVVAEGARLHEAVVLENARVAAGAVIVRSIVCAGTSVGADRMIVDQLIGAAER